MFEMARAVLAAVRHVWFYQITPVFMLKIRYNGHRINLKADFSVLEADCEMCHSLHLLSQPGGHRMRPSKP
jgi:hypothetical protein